MPLNLKIAQILDMVERANRKPFHALTPQQARAAYTMSAPILDIAPLPMFSVDDIRIPTRDGKTIGVRVYQPVEPSWAQPSFFMAGTSRSAARRRTMRCAASSPAMRDARLSQSITGSRPSTSFRSRSTMPSIRCNGSCAKLRRSASIRRASPSAGTVRAARSRATRASRFGFSY